MFHKRDTFCYATIAFFCQIWIRQLLCFNFDHIWQAKLAQPAQQAQQDCFLNHVAFVLQSPDHQHQELKKQRNIKCVIQIYKWFAKQFGKLYSLLNRRLISETHWISIATPIQTATIIINMFQKEWCYTKHAYMHIDKLNRALGATCKNSCFSMSFYMHMYIPLMTSSTMLLF